MSQAEHPARMHRDVTVDDVRQLMGASTPHFALQLRNRIAKLIRDLPAGHAARLLGEQEIQRLTALGFTGETRGHHAEEGMRPLPSVGTERRIAPVRGPASHPAAGPGSEDDAVEPHTTPAG
jgi:hypothetical protein